VRDPASGKKGTLGMVREIIVCFRETYLQLYGYISVNARTQARAKSRLVDRSTKSTKIAQNNSALYRSHDNLQLVYLHLYVP